MKNARHRLSFRAKKEESTFDPVELALRAFTFIAANDERVDRFLALTGLDPSQLRDLMGESGFHLAVLDHLAGDEPLLLAFTEAEGLSPELIGHARRMLGHSES